MSDNCLFCKIICGDIPADKLYEDDDVLVFRDIAPEAPVHFLVIPKKHISSPADLLAEDDRLIGKLMRVGNEMAVKEGVEHYRLVINNGEEAGQRVFHLHMHVFAGREMCWPPC